MRGRKYHFRKYLNSILAVLMSTILSLSPIFDIFADSSLVDKETIVHSESTKNNDDKRLIECEYLNISFINLFDGDNPKVNIQKLDLKTNKNQSLVEAYSFSKTKSYQYFKVEIDDLPEIKKGDTFSVYGIKDKKIIPNPIAMNVERGDNFYLGLFEYDGVALIQETTDISVEKQKLNNLTPEEGVSVDFEGYLPEDAQIKIEPIKGDKNTIHKYDITIYDKDGNEFQPIVGNPINITVRSDKIAKVNRDKKEILTYHKIKQHKSEEIDVISAKKDFVKFQANHFSEYIIKEHEDGDLVTPRRTYHFLTYDYEETQTSGVYLADDYNFYTTAGDLINYQIIKNGDVLQPIPNPPNKSGEYFYGWYVVDYLGKENGKTKYSWPDESSRIRFNREITVNETEDTDIYLAPIYSNYRFVTFHEGEYGEPNAVNVLTRKLVELGGNNRRDVLISDVRAKTTDSQRVVFWGWKYHDTMKQTVDSQGLEITQHITITENDLNVDLYPVFKQARWLTFVSGESGSGAEYVPSMFVVQGESVSTLPITTRKGYQFMGWYPGSQDDNGHIYYDMEHPVTDAQGHVLGGYIDLGDGNVVSDNQITLNENQTLYARWQERANSDYIVIFWKQKVSDNKNASDNEKTYDYESSEVRSGPTGTVITSSQNDKQKNYTGFHYSRTRVEGTNSESGIIDPTGKTVINVYYDRDIMSINYYFPISRTYPQDAQTAYSYTVTTANNGTQYGIVNGEYVQLTSTNETQYTFTTPYYYTQTSSTNGTLYGIYNGEYVRVYYNNGQFYRTRSWQIIGYNYSNPYSGTVYSRDSGVEYTGVRYTRSQSGGQYVYTPTTATTGTLYGVDNNGVYVQLNSTQDSVRVWQYNGEIYTGTRYTRSNMNNYRMYHWSGLYGSNFDSNGYSWSDVSGYRWNEQQNGGGTTQTLLDSFNNDNIVYNLYSQGETGNNYIYHYKQNLDGTYSLDSSVAARTNNASGTFNFTNKFQGFTVSTYSTNTEGFNPAGGSHSAAAGTSGNFTYPLYVYHTRNRYSLTYAVDYLDEETGEIENKIYKTVEGIQYGAFLNNYGSYTVPDLVHSQFTGWYEDKSGRVPFDFNTTMAASNKIVYAGFSPFYYPITIDPNGAEINHRETQYSTYTWLKYGQTLKEYRNVRREYVQDNDGEYVYLYVTFNGENNGNGINADYRNALYIKANEVDDFYDEYYSNSGLTRQEFMNCVSTTRYRKAIGSEVYSLLGWYRVNNDGTLSSTPYNFNDKVSEPIHIRAVWRLSGEYYISYNPIMTSLGIGGHIDKYFDPDTNDDEGKYIDQSYTVIRQQPTGIPEGYVFEGWRIVDGQGNPLQEGVTYDPGDDFTINARYADNSGCIHLEAYYVEESQQRKVDVTSLLLDANGGLVNERGLIPGDTKIYADTTDNQLHFDNQINNTNIHLINYIKNFKHQDKFTLIGWNRQSDPGDYIPEIAADAELGIDRKSPNILYALWEPMVYITFKNQTEEPLTFDLEFTDYDGDILKQYDGHINEVTEQYERVKFTDTTVTLQPDEVLKLVLPEGENAKYRVSGTYRGSKDRLYVYNSGGDTCITSRNQNYITGGNMIIDQVGRVVTFVDEKTVIPSPTGYNTESRVYHNMLFIALLLIFILLLFVDKKINKNLIKGPNANSGKNIKILIDYLTKKERRINMKNTLKKLLSIIVSLSFVIIMSVPTYAVEIGNGTKESVDSTLLIPKGVMVKNSSRGDYGGPQLVYTYTIAPVEPVSGATVSGVPVEIGPVGGVTLADNGRVTFNNEIVNGVTNEGIEQRKNITVNTDITKFTKPGVYRYVLTDTTSMEAMYGAAINRPDDYDTTRYLDVYIKYNEDGTALIIGGYTLSKNNVAVSDATTKDTGFVASSEQETVSGEVVMKNDSYRLYNIDIYKKVTGSMGDKTHEFPFSYTVQNYGLKYRPGYYMEGNITTESSGTFKLSNNNSFSFRGLSPRSTITITETNDTSKIYEVKIDGKNVSTATTWTNLVPSAEVAANGTKVLPVGAITNYEDVNSAGDGTNPGSIDEEGVLNKNRTAIQFTNNAGDISPTGLILRFAPFIIMLGFAVVLVATLKKKSIARDL